jgi:hypothetical protein
MRAHALSNRLIDGVVAVAVLPGVILALLIAVAAPPAARAEIIFAVGSSSPNLGAGTGHLYSFDSATPGVVTDVVVNGPGFNGQFLVDIDFAPGTSTLYGLGYTGSVYSLNTTTALATSVATALSLGGPDYNLSGIDFNPATGLLRVVDPNEGNRSLNIATNTRVNDTDPAYGAADVNAGRIPYLQDIAYTSGAASYVLDFAGGSHNAPILAGLSPETGGAGSLTTIGNLGAAGFAGGFDVSSNTGIAYAILNSDGFNSNTKTLYSINLATGAATSLGVVNIDSGVEVYGLAVAPAPGGGGNGVPLPRSAYAAIPAAGLALLLSRKPRPRNSPLSR